MTYQEAVDYIHSLLAFGIKPGLSRIQALLRLLGDPQNDLRFVHVAGTNGKGSTSTMLSSVLIEAGYKTGLFTSPYVFSFCERIQINNQNIAEHALAEVVEQVKAAIEQLHTQNIVPTEFEAITAAALLYFRQQHCDIAVLEVGLGGRFDSTNIIPCPAVSVITSISLDHTQILGDTIEKIAAEKAGIIKENGITVTTSLQDPAALSVIQDTAKAMHNPLYIGDAGKVRLLSEQFGKTVFVYENEVYELPLTGRHQIENAVGVITAAKALEGVTSEHIRNGIRKTVMRGRMELRAGQPNLLLDGGHNPECGTALSEVLRQFAPDAVTAVIGMMRDKDTTRYLQAVLPHCRAVWFTRPDNPRAADPTALAGEVQDIQIPVFTEPDPLSAYRRACTDTPENGLVLVCGSFYLLSDLFGAE